MQSTPDEQAKHWFRPAPAPDESVVRFRLRRDAELWFRELEGKDPIETKFDFYYFCLMAGLASGRRCDISGLETIELVGDFVLAYRPVQLLLIGLLVDAEVRKSGIDLRERDDVRSEFSRLVSARNSTQLSSTGMRCMNDYASGGFDFLKESAGIPPVSTEEFLRSFMGYIEKALNDRSFT